MHGKSEVKTKIVPASTMIFISNSPKDGFNEGDGDLMDKLTTQLNRIHPNIAATRIIGEIAPESIKRPKGQLVALDELPDTEDASLASFHPCQQKLIQYILSSPAENKILYIGSRIENYRKKVEGFSISLGSGALFIEDVVLHLKKHGVKVVVCCLEVVFQTRSLATSFRLYETLRHQLQHADVIHYLTERDQHYVEHELPLLLQKKAPLVCAEYPTAYVEAQLTKPKVGKKDKELMEHMLQFFTVFFEKDQKQLERYFSYFHQEELIGRIRSIPGVYASGICTISKVEDEDITIEALMKRPANVLVFGLIRPHKGIAQGVALGKYFKEKGSSSTVYVVGKVLGLTDVLAKLFAEVFDAESLRAKGINLKARLSACHRSGNYNKSFQDLYDDLVAAGVTKKANVVLALNVSEKELLRYSMLCRYALKLDLKGFAENASAMISTMIGLCLPVITQPGLVTPSFVKRFVPALHMLDSKLAVCGGEVMPESVDVRELGALIEESEERYLQRLQTIFTLRASKQFDIQTTTRTLLYHAFLPLCKMLLVHKPSPHGRLSPSAPTFFTAIARRPAEGFSLGHRTGPFIMSKL